MGLLDIFRRTKKKEALIGFDIEDKSSIHKKLEELCNDQTPCDVKIGEIFFTSIFIKKHDNYIVLDVLMPVAGNDRLIDGTEFEIGYAENEIPYRMDCVFQGKELENGYEALTFSIPDIIHYNNRRDYYRVAPNKRNPVRLLLDLGHTSMVKDEVHNISGSGIAMKGEIQNLFEDGDTIDRIDIALPGGGWVSCKGKVARKAGTIIGVEMYDISYNDRREIIRYVTSRQNEDLSKRGKD